MPTPTNDLLNDQFYSYSNAISDVVFISTSSIPTITLDDDMIEKLRVFFGIINPRMHINIKPEELVKILRDIDAQA